MITAFYLTGAHHYLTLENIQRNLSELKALNESRPVYFFCLFFGIYLLLASLSIPGTIVLTLLSGTIFGAFAGTFFVLVICTIGSAMAFLMSRYLFRDIVARRFSRQYTNFEAHFKERGLGYLFVMRLIPVSPYVLINLLMGLTNIKLWPFMWITFVGMMPGTFVYVLAGKELSKIKSPSDILTPPIILSLTALALLPFVLRKAVSFFNRSEENYGR